MCACSVERVRVVLAVPGIEPKEDLPPLKDLVAQSIGPRPELNVRHLVSLRRKVQVLIARVEA